MTYTFLDANPGRTWVVTLFDVSGPGSASALRCLVRRPGCVGCPVQVHCRAYPAILELTANRRPRTSPSSSRYEGTNRYYRGRVLAALRALPEDDQDGVPLDTLGSSLREDYQADQSPWLYELVTGLSRDGLAHLAEERSVYDAGADGEPAGIADLGKVRVRLP